MTPHHGRGRRPLACALGLSGAVALGACGGGPAVDLQPIPRPSADGSAAIAETTASALYADGLAVLADSMSVDGTAANGVTSPVGFSVTLAQIALGAQGPARDAVDGVLGVTGDADLRAQYGQVWALWSPWLGDPQAVRGKTVPDTPVIALNGRIVADDQTTLTATWTQALADTWGTPVETLDLQGGGAKADLDRWVDTATGGLVKKSAIVLDQGTRVVGQNAVVFGAPWQSPFDPDQTAPQSFTRADGSAHDVDMMHQTLSARALVTADLTAITLPYGDGGLVAHVLMPAGAGALTSESVRRAIADLDGASAGPVDLALPKVDTEGFQDLAPTLAALGAGDLFTAGDFAPMGAAEDGPLALGQFSAQTVLRMDEAGTVAAAVHEFAMTTSADGVGPEPLAVTIDHPYLVVLADAATATPLFMAWIGDPAASGT